MKRSLLTVFIAALGIAMLAPDARATILTPGAIFTTNVSSSAIVPAGSLEATISSTFVAPASPPFAYSGTMSEQVIQESTVANPLGGLTFVYHITNDATSSDSPRVTLNGYSGTTVDFYVQSSSSYASVDVKLQSSGAISISGYFPPSGPNTGGLLPGTSLDVFVRTDAGQFYTGNVLFQNDAQASADALVPVPEPSSVILAGLGVFGLLGCSVWRRRQALAVC